MTRISAVKRRNAWRRATREVGVLFVAFGLGEFAFTIFKGTFELLQALFLAVFLNVAGLLAINYSIETEEEETAEEANEEANEEKQNEKQNPAQTLASVKPRPLTTTEFITNLATKSTTLFVPLFPLLRRIRRHKSPGDDRG